MPIKYYNSKPNKIPRNGGKQPVIVKTVQQKIKISQTSEYFSNPASKKKNSPVHYLLNRQYRHTQCWLHFCHLLSKKLYNLTTWNLNILIQKIRFVYCCQWYDYQRHKILGARHILLLYIGNRCKGHTSSAIYWQGGREKSLKDQALI